MSQPLTRTVRPAAWQTEPPLLKSRSTERRSVVTPVPQKRNAPSFCFALRFLATETVRSDIIIQTGSTVWLQHCPAPDRIQVTRASSQSRRYQPVHRRYFSQRTRRRSENTDSQPNDQWQASLMAAADRRTDCVISRWMPAAAIYRQPVMNRDDRDWRHIPASCSSTIDSQLLRPQHRRSGRGCCAGHVRAHQIPFWRWVWRQAFARSPGRQHPHG